MSTDNDRLSSEILGALDKLNYDFNRVLLQALLDKEMTIQQIEGLHFNCNISLAKIRVNISSLEKARLVTTTLRQDQKGIEKVKITFFGEILLRGLLVAQKLLEAKDG